MTKVPNLGRVAQTRLLTAAAPNGMFGVVTIFIVEL